MTFRRTLLKIVPAAVALCIILCSGARNAQEDPFADPRFDTIIDSYNLKDAPVADVLRLIAEQNNLNIVMSPSVTGTVNLRLSSVSLREVLNVILEASNSRIEKTDNIIHVYSNSEFDDKMREGLMITEVFQVNYVDGEQLISILSGYLSKDGSVKNFERRNQSTRGIKSDNNRERSSRSTPKDMLIFTDYPENIEKVREMFNILDSETRQVMIESRIVETTLTDSDILGTDWKIGAALNGSPASFDTRYGGKIGYGSLSMSGFSAVYSRLMEDKNSNILSNAKLAVMDNEQAHIHVGETIPVGISTIGAGGGGNTNFGTTGIQQWEVGVTLDVTPTVLENEVIRMYIRPEISTVQGYSAVGSGSAPITSSRGVQTQILIKSGETIVIGGLVQDQESISNSKVPVLGDLPFVGSAFRKKGTTKSKVNLLIFITGTLLELKSDYQPEVLISPSIRAEMEAEKTAAFMNMAREESTEKEEPVAEETPAVEETPAAEPAVETPAEEPAIEAPVEPAVETPAEPEKPNLEKYLEYK